MTPPEEEILMQAMVPSYATGLQGVQDTALAYGIGSNRTKMDAVQQRVASPCLQQPAHMSRAPMADMSRQVPPNTRSRVAADIRSPCLPRSAASCVSGAQEATTIQMRPPAIISHCAHAPSAGQERCKCSDVQSDLQLVKRFYDNQLSEVFEELETAQTESKSLRKHNEKLLAQISHGRRCCVEIASKALQVSNTQAEVSSYISALNQCRLEMQAMEDQELILSTE